MKLVNQLETHLRNYYKQKMLNQILEKTMKKIDVSDQNPVNSNQVNTNEFMTAELDNNDIFSNEIQLYNEKNND